MGGDDLGGVDGDDDDDHWSTTPSCGAWQAQISAD